MAAVVRGWLDRQAKRHYQARLASNFAGKQVELIELPLVLAGVTLVVLGLTPGSADDPTRTVDKKKPAEAGSVNAEDTKRRRTGSHVRDISLERHG